MKLNRKGVTLIELLVIICIIALLIACPIPSIKKIKELEEKASSREHGRVISVTMNESCLSLAVQGDHAKYFIDVRDNYPTKYRSIHSLFLALPKDTQIEFPLYNGPENIFSTDGFGKLTSEQITIITPEKVVSPEK